MHPERWRRIKEYLDVALRLDPSERESYLTRVCESDSELREEVNSLIVAYEASGDLFEEPPEPPKPRDPLLGARIGPYRIVEHIGSGGMGAVYRATRVDEVFQKEVAIKVVKRGLDLEYVIRQFRRERQIMATLEHPNIATLMDGGTTEDGLPYFVMEFIRGKPIDTYCRDYNLDIRARLRLFRVVCGAVEFAHRQGIVHRDIKPGNILVTDGGVPKLLDFGIAKILNPEIVRGTLMTTVAPAMTPEYASPEQLAGASVSEASDVFSLGVLLCELLSGKRPYPPQTAVPGETWRDKIAQPPSVLAHRRDLAGDLDNIVLMAVRIEPERRYASAGELDEDIGRYLEGRPVKACKDSIAYRTRKFLRRQKPALISASLAIAIPAAALLTWEIWNRRTEPSDPPRIVPVTSMPGQEFQPYFSPDGRNVVYASSGENGENTDIYIHSLDSGGNKRLTTDVAEDVSPVWSPDGSRIAWLRSGLKETAIFVSPVGGGVHGKIADIYANTGLEALGRHLDWSPDGKWLAAADKNDSIEPFRIVLIGVKDGSKRQATFPTEKSIGDMSPAFSPDGKKLAFIRAFGSGINDVYVVPVEGGREQRVTSDNRDVMGLAWTPDGRSIVFSSNRLGNTALWRVSESSGPPVRVGMVSDNATDPAFSRDGRKLVFTQSFEDTNIWRIETSGRGSPRRAIASTQYDSSPQISPDGTRVTFRSSRSGSAEIWVSDPDGRNAVQVTRFGGPLTGTPRWSPDGKEIAFDSRPDRQAKIYAIPSSGGEPRRISSGPAEDVVPSWSRDGRYVYFASNRTGIWQVWRASAAGGDERQVTFEGGFAAFESPDGEYLYYSKMRIGRGLWRKRLPDGKEEPVLDQLKPGYWGYWGVVEDGIYYADQPVRSQAAGIYFYPFSTRRPKLIANVEKPLRMADSAFAVSPDRKYVLYSQVDESGSDILMLENYR